MFDRKHFLNTTASPLDAIVVMCFTMCNTYYLHTGAGLGGSDNITEAFAGCYGRARATTSDWIISAEGTHQLCSFVC